MVVNVAQHAALIIHCVDCSIVVDKLWIGWCKGHCTCKSIVGNCRKCANVFKLTNQLLFFYYKGASHVAIFIKFLSCLRDAALCCCRVVPGSYRYFIVIFGAAVPGSLDKKGVRRCHLLLNKDGRCLTNSARSWVADAHFKMRGFTVPMEYRYTLQHSSVGLNGILWTQQHWFKSIARIILSHGNLC
jgi:hypothetical protein